VLIAQIGIFTAQQIRVNFMEIPLEKKFWHLIKSAASICCKCGQNLISPFTSSRCDVESKPLAERKDKK
jgi:hypothetical protein